jgi:FOG: CheY-like receiver
MPIMDGFEASKILTDKMKNNEITTIPIYALSANDLESQKDRAIESGMEGYIKKPLTEYAIHKIMKRHGLLN